MSKFKLPQRLDTSSAPDVEKKLTALLNMEKPKMLVCDFSQTVYVSSAGLRVMLVMAKTTKKVGTEFVLGNMQQSVYDIFKMSGFDSILDIRNSLE